MGRTSLIHHLTVGFLDEAAVRRRELTPLRPISEPVLSLLAQFLDAGNEHQTMEGGKLEVSGFFIRCPWYMPTRNRTAERFSVKAMELGCLVADLEHARLVTLDELTAP